MPRLLIFALMPVVFPAELGCVYLEIVQFVQGLETQPGVTIGMQIFVFGAMNGNTVDFFFGWINLIAPIYGGPIDELRTCVEYLRVCLNTD